MDFPSSLQFKSKIRRVTVCPIENPFNQKLLQNVFWQLRLEGTIKLYTDMNPSSITDHNFAYFENSLDFFKNLTETILVLILWVSKSSLAASVYFEPWGGKFIKKHLLGPLGGLGPILTHFWVYWFLSFLESWTLLT